MNVRVLMSNITCKQLIEGSSTMAAGGGGWYWKAGVACADGTKLKDGDEKCLRSYGAD